MKKNLGRWAGLMGLALAGVGAAWLGVKRTEEGLSRRLFAVAGKSTDEGGISGLEFAPERANEHTPAMIVAHGFSGCKELMQFIGAEIGRRGVRTLLFDFSGHGASPVPFLPPTNVDFSQVVNRNVGQIERIYSYIRDKMPEAPVGVLGHSMGSGAITFFAAKHPELKATIPVSPVGDLPVDKTMPRNLLALVGQRDIPISISSAWQLLRQANGNENAPTETTLGDFAKGTARRMKVLKGLDHISILYAPATVKEITDWIDRCFGTEGPAQIRTAERLRWTGVGLVAAFSALFPYARLLTGALGVAGKNPKASGFKLSDHAGAIAWLLGSQFASVLVWNKAKLPKLVRLQLGDYIAAFFGLSGVISWAGLLLFGQGRLKLTEMAQGGQGGTAAKAKAWLALPFDMWLFTYLVLGRFSRRTWMGFTLTPPRRKAMALIVPAMLPYFLADEYVYRRVGGWKGYGLSMLGKLGVIAALLLAVRLKPELSFLVILLPVMLLTFALFGFYSLWQYQQGHDFVTTAVFQTLVFAWMVSTLFPVI
jgi:pimeloyl-ACP methyl ester carboxylesterase